MDISNQIKKRRTDMGLSQEELAERIYVSRQTISNWETDKTYPDIQSLLLLSILFDTTIDVLVKGDLDMMENTVASADAKRMRTLAITMSALLVLMIPFALAGIALWGPLGILLGLAPWAASMVVSVILERIKVENDVQTYREILARLPKGQARRQDESHRARRQAPGENEESLQQQTALASSYTRLGNWNRFYRYRCNPRLCDGDVLRHGSAVLATHRRRNKTAGTAAAPFPPIFLALS